MKLFVATDVHGSAYWAQRIVDNFVESGADMLVLLGDVYNHGPRNPFPREYDPMRVAEIFNSVADKTVAVQGNCDSEVDAMISRFPFVKDCVIPLGGRRLYFTHGHVYNSARLPNVSEGDAVIYGHFHVNGYERVNGVHCVCLSSAALPKDSPAYLTADDGGLTVNGFDGEKIFSLMFEV